MDRKSIIAEESMEHNSRDCRVPGCEECTLNIPFEMPSEIVDAYKNGNLIIFTGSGVSTESPNVYPSTFYQYIKNVIEN